MLASGEHAARTLDRIALRQGDVAYRRAGSGPPMILLHGWATSSRFWLTSLSRFAPIRTCYALDMPGFGESPALTEPTTVARFAAIVIEFADALGLERVDLETHSFGAAVGMYLAAHWPDRVRRLVLTSYGLLHDPNDPWYITMRLWLQMYQLYWQPVYNQLDPLMRALQPLSQTLVDASPLPLLLEQMLFVRSPEDTKALEEEVSDVTRMDIRAHIGCLLSSSDPELFDAIPRVKAPTLLICGQGDLLVPGDGAAKLHAMIPHSRLLMLPECGHVPVLEYTDLYHEQVCRFLDDNDAG